MATFSITIKRITDNNSPMIQELIALDKLKGKARLPYEPLEDAEHTFTVQATDRREAYKLANRDNTLRFTGQERQTWIDGTQEFGNY